MELFNFDDVFRFLNLPPAPQLLFTICDRIINVKNLPRINDLGWLHRGFFVCGIPSLRNPFTLNIEFPSLCSNTKLKTNASHSVACFCLTRWVSVRGSQRIWIWNRIVYSCLIYYSFNFFYIWDSLFFI